MKEMVKKVFLHHSNCPRLCWNKLKTSNSIFLSYTSYVILVLDNVIGIRYICTHELEYMYMYMYM